MPGMPTHTPRDTVITKVEQLHSRLGGYFYRVQGRVRGRAASIDIPIAQLKTPPYDGWTDAQVREFFLRSLPLGVEGRYTPDGQDILPQLS